MDSIRLTMEPIRSVAFGSIGAAYTGIGSAFSNCIRIIFLQNLTDTQLMFSDDGVDDKLTLPANGFMMLDMTANKTDDQGLFLPIGGRWYVKQVVAPSSGSVYLTAFYAEV